VFADHVGEREQAQQVAQNAASGIADCCASTKQRLLLLDEPTGTIEEVNASIARRRAIALVAPVPIVLLTRWYDVEVLQQSRLGAAVALDPAGTARAFSIGYLLAMAGGLALAWLAHWSRSDIVAAIYLVVGGALTLLMPIFWTVAPGLPPGAIQSALFEFVVWAEQGVIKAVPLDAAAMFIGGLGALLAGRFRTLTP
jgi:hypothetical protein